jgi:hypothetical protein
MPSTDRVCQSSPKSLFSRPLLTFFKTSLIGVPPWDPSRAPLDWVGCCVPVRGLPIIGARPLRSPAVRRKGFSALMVAALLDHSAIIEKFVDARADVNTQNLNGCAFPGPFGVCRRWPMVADCAVPRPAGSQRCTMRRTTATPNPPCGCSSVGPTRPSRTPTGALCLSQPSDGRTSIGPLGAGRRLANTRKLPSSSSSTTWQCLRCGRRHCAHSTYAACCVRCARRICTAATLQGGLRRTARRPRHDLRFLLRALEPSVGAGRVAVPRLPHGLSSYVRTWRVALVVLPGCVLRVTTWRALSLQANTHACTHARTHVGRRFAGTFQAAKEKEAEEAAKTKGQEVRPR